MAMNLIRKWQIDYEKYYSDYRESGWSKGKIDVVDKGDTIEFNNLIKLSKKDFQDLADVIARNDL